MGIFNRFLDRIYTHQTITESHQAVSSEDYVVQFDHYKELTVLQDQRQLVEVLLPDYKNSFQSMITGIDFIQGHFSLDEFSPSIAKPESLISQHLVLRHQKDWQMLEVSAKVVDWSEREHCYWLSLPEVAIYQPRRADNRLVLSEQNILNTHINPLYGSPWYATVKDISVGGMRVSVSGDLRPHLHKDKLLPKCQVMLDKDMTISCRGKVKAFSYSNRPYRHTDVSIEFDGISYQHLEYLKSFISYVEVAA